MLPAYIEENPVVISDRDLRPLQTKDCHGNYLIMKIFHEQYTPSERSRSNSAQSHFVLL